MNARDENTVTKRLREWWRSPPRSGVQRLIAPPEYRHVRAFGIARVVGGIVATAADLLLELVRSEIARRLPPAMMQALTIAPAALGAEGAAIGAAKLAAPALQ